MTDPPTPPPAIVERALQHNRDALEELLLLRYDWLKTVAHRAIPVHLREQISIDEVLQDAFVRVLRGYSKFSPHSGEAGLFQWMKTIVQNTALDALRKTTRNRERAMSDQRQSPQMDESVATFINSLAVAEDPRASVVAREEELRHAFRVALAQLDPRYQQVIDALYFEQLTVEQTARKLDLTPAAVRGLRQRARDKIRESMVRLSHFV